MIVLLIKFQIGKLFCLKLVNFTFLKHTEVIFFYAIPWTVCHGECKEGLLLVVLTDILPLPSTVLITELPPCYQMLPPIIQNIYCTNTIYHHIH